MVKCIQKIYLSVPIVYKNSQGTHYGDKVAECPNCGTKLKWED